MADTDDTSMYNNDPNEEQEEEKKIVVKIAKPRSRTAHGFDGTKDAHCVAILKFLGTKRQNDTTKPVTFSRSETVDINGETVAVGTLMYNLRRQANAPASQTALSKQRLAFLQNDELWKHFLTLGRVFKKGNDDDEKEMTNDEKELNKMKTVKSSNNTETKVNTTIPINQKECQGMDAEVEKYVKKFMMHKMNIVAIKCNFHRAMLGLWRCFPQARPHIVRMQIRLRNFKNKTKKNSF